MSEPTVGITSVQVRESMILLVRFLTGDSSAEALRRSITGLGREESEMYLSAATLVIVVLMEVQPQLLARLREFGLCSVPTVQGHGDDPTERTRKSKAIMRAAWEQVLAQEQDQALDKHDQTH